MPNSLSRRHFLEVIIVGTAGTAGAIACSGSAGSDPEPFGDVTAGNVSALQVDTVKAVPGEPVFIGRDKNGVYAMTTTCTHQGCDMSSNGVLTSEVTCGCHGSTFDLNGNVLSGPAKSSLAHFEVSIAADGAITIHGGTRVGPTVRTAAG